MTAEHAGPPEVEIIEATAERLDDVEPLWRAMHEYHAEVAGQARSYGALTYFRCIAHHDDYFEHVDGDGYGEVHNYRLVPLTPRGRQRRCQR